MTERERGSVSEAKRVQYHAPAAGEFYKVWEVAGGIKLQDKADAEAFREDLQDLIDEHLEDGIDG